MPPPGTTPRPVTILTILLAGLMARCDRSTPPPATQPAAASQPATAPADGINLDRSVRVMLARDVPECAVTIAGPFDIVNGNSGVVLGTVDHSQPLTVLFANNTTRIEEIERVFTAVCLDLRPRTRGILSLQMNGSARRYRGGIRLLRRVPDAGCVLNLVEVEDYLPGVITAEMPASYQPAALRAQAIASRTFVWYMKRFYGPGRDWDVNSNESSQMYHGVDGELPQGQQAVDATAGLVCAWAAPDGDRIFPAYYGSLCGGVTRPAALSKGEPPIPTLAGDVVCEYCAPSKSFHWGPVPIPKQQVSDRLHNRVANVRPLGTIVAANIVTRTAHGRPLRVEVTDDTGRTAEMDVTAFRLAVDSTGRDIRSGYFTLIDEGDTLTFADGHGLGHGMGMCQYGANCLAKIGKTTTEILEFYYPGCRIIRAY